MADRFLEHYADELDALRRRAARFAGAFPKIAGRLRLSPETSDDPHVERMIQSFAYSAARLRQKLDDGFPELSEGLLETLYPHFLAPVPAMTIVAMAPDAGVDELRRVPRGTEIEAEPVRGDACRFRTVQDVTLAPVRIAAARMMNRPLEAPPLPGASPLGCLALTLEPTAKARIDALGIETLRLHLAGPDRLATELFRLLTQHAVGVAVADHPGDPAPRRLPAGAVRPVGYRDDEAALPLPAGSFPGYRLLTEFFAMPDRFLFVDVDLGRPTQADRADVYVYLDAAPGELERRVDASAFVLGAVPVVNLFPARAEPILLDGTRPAYPLVADARRPLTRRVHSVTHVTLADADGRTAESAPYFHRAADPAAGGAFHQIVRHPPEGEDGPGATSLAFVDHRARRADAPGTTASVEVLATNGDLPRALPFGGGQPRLRLASPLDGVGTIACLRPIAMPPRPDADPDRTWQLVSHLSLNHLSLDGPGAAAGLRALLRLHDPGDSRETSQYVDAIHDVETRPAIARIAAVMVSGLDVTVTFDPDRIGEGAAHLFGTVLDRFLGGYVTVNAFTRLTLRMRDRTDRLATFPPRAGEGALA